MVSKDSMRIFSIAETLVCKDRAIAVVAISLVIVKVEDASSVGGPSARVKSPQPCRNDDDRVGLS